MKKYRLYVDESGTSHPKNHSLSPYYILVGCIIEEKQQQELKIQADQIKFKYWGHTNIVFHSVDIAKKIKDFSIFKNNPALDEDFHKDLCNLLVSANIHITICLIDKKIAHARRWGEKRVIKTASDSVMGGFLAYIFAHKPCRGKIVIEATGGSRDQLYLAGFDYYLSPNFSKNDPDFKNVREHLTSINFVTKQNHDIETQISDILSYAAKCQHQKSLGLKKFSSKDYESKLIKILNSKLIKTAQGMGKTKKVFYKKINSFEVTPKPISEPSKQQKSA